MSFLPKIQRQSRHATQPYKRPSEPALVGTISLHTLVYLKDDIEPRPRPDYSPLRKDFLALKQYLTIDQTSPARLAAAPTGSSNVSSLYSRSFGSAWRT